MGPLPLLPSQSISEEHIHVELTYEPLSITGTLNRVRSPKAGALVLFAGLESLTLLVFFFSRLFFFVSSGSANTDV